MNGVLVRATWNRLKSISTKTDLLWWLVVAIGLVLRLQQYVANRSLSNDEAALALNLVNRTFGELTQPLDYEQGAPIGFLLIEKLAIVITGNHDYILRFFPIFSGLLATYLIYRIAKDKLGTAGLFAVFVFSISWTLVDYSAILKQYSSDVMIALLLVYLSLRCIGDTTHFQHLILLGAGGIIAIWISHPSAFILVGIGLVLVLDKLTTKAYVPLILTFAIGILWMASLGLEYLVSLRNLIANEFLQNFWRGGFMPLPPWSHLNWFNRTYLDLLVSTSPSLYYPYLTLSCSFLLIVGIISIFLRDRITALLMTLPFLIASLASAMERYPLKGRLLLFLVPFLILLVAEGLGRIYTLFSRWNRALAVILCTTLITITLWLPAYGALRRFSTTTTGQDFKSILRYVEDNKAQNDVIYVSDAALTAFYYYAPFYGLDKGKILIGNKLPKINKISRGEDLDGPDLGKFFSEINSLKGNDRVWFIFLDNFCDNCVELFYIQHLDQLGRVQDRFGVPGSAAYLYDLKP